MSSILATLKRHRAEIRALSGARETTVADGEALTDWLRDHAVADSRDTRFDALLRPAVAAEQKIPADDEPDGPFPAVLMHLRSDPGEPSVNSLQAELVKLDLVRKLGLPADLFAHAPSHEVERYSQRVAVEAPYELGRHAEPFRLTALAASAHLRGRSLTDGLVDLLIGTIHRIGAHAERKVERELLDDLKRVSGKQNILFEFSVAGVLTLRDLVKEWKATGPVYRTTLRTAADVGTRQSLRTIRAGYDNPLAARLNQMAQPEGQAQR
jgi:hypothetical protein